MVRAVTLVEFQSQAARLLDLVRETGDEIVVTDGVYEVARLVPGLGDLVGSVTFHCTPEELLEPATDPDDWDLDQGEGIWDDELESRPE